MRYWRTTGMNIYLELTKRFNEGQLRAILAGGQAVVLHRLAIMSKDGDWILREEEAALSHILAVLARYGARYRFGAPLALRWMSKGWSSHLEFKKDGLRVRTDFMTRPPRLAPADLARMWRENEHQDIPFAGIRDLIEMKKTNREKDYAVIGELARRLVSVDDKLLCCRSARDLLAVVAGEPARAKELSARRPVLAAAVAGGGVAELEVALDAERRALIHGNEQRLGVYERASGKWFAAWPRISKQIESFDLPAAHAFLVNEASKMLPTDVEGGLA